MAFSGLCLKRLSSEAAGATRFSGKAALSTSGARNEHGAMKKKKLEQKTLE